MVQENYDKKYGNIPVLLETKERVDKLGTKGDTYDDIITMLLNEHDQLIQNKDK